MRLVPILPALLLFAAAPARADDALPLPLPASPAASPQTPVPQADAQAKPVEAPPAPQQPQAAPATPEPQAEPASFAGFNSVPHDVLLQFQAKYLSVDFEGHASRGKAHEPVEEGAFLREAGRPELAAQLDRNRRTRVILMGVAGGLVVAGVAGAGVELATRPDLNSEHCAASHIVYNNECVPDYDRHGAMAAGFAAVGVVAGAVLGISAYQWDTTPVTPLEAKDLVNAHNTELWRTLRSQPAQPVSIAPWVSPNGGGLALARRF